MDSHIRFSSDLDAEPARVWRWITSFDGINAELAPFLSMSAPSGVRCIDDLAITPGEPMFTSWIRLFGWIPVDFSKLTLTWLETGRGFVEESSMGSMRYWRHERIIVPHAEGCTLVDKLTFKSRLPEFMVMPLVKHLFEHRHKNIRKNLSGQGSWHHFSAT